ncbi:MAG: sigma-70 family RNA polymerase sigma factor [Verrucomicrobia bacterium]|nr:sigma-70 family RNA polymerase sigma factor [Verrucomicrobiota bacterium]
MLMKSDDTIPTRLSLIERLKNWDDQTSWQDFFNTYWRLIYGVARQAGLTDAEAQDVVQETVISVAKKMGDFKADRAYGSFKSWLLQITRRRIIDQFRKRRPQNETRMLRRDETVRTPTVQRIPEPAGPPLDALWQEEWEQNLMEVALEKVKQKVSSKQFLLFHQLVVKQWSPKKIADQYGVSLAQVYMAKYRVSALVKKEVRNLEKRPY